MLTLPHALAGLPAAEAEATTDICLSCTAKPCLQACPVDAFGPGRYDVPALEGLGAMGLLDCPCLPLRTKP